MPVHAHHSVARSPSRVVSLLGAIALCATLAACSSGSASTTASSAAQPSSTGFDGAALPSGVKDGAPFTLTDQHGRRVSLASYRGQVVVLAFVYSTCGAPCVIIAQQIRGALDELAAPVPVLLVSADPAADTRARVARFLTGTSLSGRVSYLSGSPAELRPVWHAFHVTPARAHRAAFARTASVFLIDRAGHERVIFQLEQLTPEALAHDIRRLLATASY
jgi:protein SCO1/2